MDANRSRFTRCGAVYRMEERHIKRAAESEALGKNRRTRKHRSMRAFFILDEGDLEPGLCSGDFLECIEIFNLLLEAFVQDGVSQGEETATRPDFVGIRSTG